MDGTQSSGLEGIVQAILIFISEVVFQWIPATMSVLTGSDVPGSTQQIDQEASPGTQDGEVSLEGTVFTSEGTAYPLFPGGTNAEQRQLNQETSFPTGGSESDAQSGVSAVRDFVMPISIFISLLLAAGIIYTTIRVFQIRMRERRALQMVERSTSGGTQDSSRTQRRWSQIVEQSSSSNESDWRLAILEADIMLDELLESQGYHGDTMGDKMKQVEKSDFNTINMAWEAHKIRNRIAHSGSDHFLNQRETNRVIGLYEQVFKEFHFV